MEAFFGVATMVAPFVVSFLRLSPEQTVLVTMYAKNVRENIDPELLRRLKEMFEDG